MYITMLHFYLPKKKFFYISRYTKLDLDGSVDEEMIRAEGYGNGMLTVNKVKTYDIAKQSRILFFGMVWLSQECLEEY